MPTHVLWLITANWLFTCTIPPIYKTIKKYVILLLGICKVLSIKTLLRDLYCEYNEVIQLEPLINPAWSVPLYLDQMPDWIEMTSLNMATSVVEFNDFKPGCSTHNTKPVLWDYTCLVYIRAFFHNIFNVRYLFIGMGIK